MYCDGKMCSPKIHVLSFTQILKILFFVIQRLHIIRTNNLEKAVVGAWRQVACQADVVVEAPEIFHLWDEVKYV